MSTKIDIGIKEADRAKIAQGLSRLLADTYRIGHTTLQVDHAPDPLLTIRRGTPAPPGDGHCPQAHGPAHHHRDSRG